MRTTLLNPTVWLLAITGAVSLAGAVRGQRARPSFDRVVRLATTWTALAMLGVLAVVGLGSRLVLGYLSPGAYAEEVVGARAYMAERTVYGADARMELQQWMSEAPASMDPWALPGITPCQASAMGNRPRFYTSQGHPPTLLLASVPVVQALGGRGLYVLLALASLVAGAVVVVIVARETGAAGQVRVAWLLGATLLGWQPVVAGIRQGDAVVLAGALVVVAWHGMRREAPGTGIAGGVAASLTLPALAVIPALLRARGHAGTVACAVLTAIAGAVTLAAGPLVLVDFSSTLLLSARTYAEAAQNYALMGRALVNGLDRLALGTLVIAAAATFWRGRSRDTAIGAWMTLGLLAAPIVWSQHLVLAFVPILVVCRRIVRNGSALALAGWALLVLLLSLPDPAVAHLHDLQVMLSPGLATIPVVSLGLIALWAWLVLGAEPTTIPEGLAVPYEVARVVS
jgi:Glycosyltransferase family 87